MSEFAVVFPATVCNTLVILRVSVVSGECLPLLSKPARQQLGMNVDWENHVITSDKLGVKTYGLDQAA